MINLQYHMKQVIVFLLLYFKCILCIALDGAMMNNNIQNNYLMSPLSNELFVFDFAPKANLTSFTVVPINLKLVKLEWTIEDANDVSYYIIQRSSNNEDWNTIQKVLHTKSKERHSFADIAPKEGMNYYCLKIVNLNGKHSYSPVRLAVVGPPNKTTVTIYSNTSKYKFSSNESGSNKITRIKTYDVDTESLAINLKASDENHFSFQMINLKNIPSQEYKIEAGSTRGVASKE